MAVSYNVLNCFVQVSNPFRHMVPARAHSQNRLLNQRVGTGFIALLISHRLARQAYSRGRDVRGAYYCIVAFIVVVAETWAGVIAVEPVQQIFAIVMGGFVIVLLVSISMFVLARGASADGKEIQGDPVQWITVLLAGLVYLRRVVFPAYGNSPDADRYGAVPRCGVTSCEQPEASHLRPQIKYPKINVCVLTRRDLRWIFSRF